MIADILDCMQWLFDYIEAKRLGNPLPFNDQPHLECFAIPFRKELEAAIFWLRMLPCRPRTVHKRSTLDPIRTYWIVGERDTPRLQLFAFQSKTPRVRYGLWSL
jgi:hypothetical protein